MELDDAYANAAHIPGAAKYPSRWMSDASAFRAALEARGRAETGIPYGKGARQVFDLFRTEGPAKGLCVFVHGGYWLRFDRSYWSHLAAGALARGWAVAMPSYDLCPDVRICEITRQIAQAVTSAAARVNGPLVLTGHSAGGHLVARMCVDGVLPEDVGTRLQQVVPISPVADLRPLLKTSMNDQFRMDIGMAEAESPVLMAPRNVPVTVWVGGEERPVFLDQAQWLAQAWGCGLKVAEGRHHFDVIDALAEPKSELCTTLCG